MRKLRRNSHKVTGFVLALIGLMLALIGLDVTVWSCFTVAGSAACMV